MTSSDLHETSSDLLQNACLAARTSPSPPPRASCPPPPLWGGSSELSAMPPPGLQSSFCPKCNLTLRWNVFVQSTEGGQVRGGPTAALGRSAGTWGGQLGGDRTSEGRPGPRTQSLGMQVKKSTLMTGMLTSDAGRAPLLWRKGLHL